MTNFYQGAFHPGKPCSFWARILAFTVVITVLASTNLWALTGKARPGNSAIGRTVKTGTAFGSNIFNEVCTPPVSQTVTGGGSVCSGSGALIGLSGSQADVTYNLRDASNTITQVYVSTGTGSFSFTNPVTTAGVYTVDAFTTGTTSCSSTMSGSAAIIIKPTPTFGSLLVDPEPMYQGKPFSLTAVANGLVPNTTQTITFSINDVDQPAVTLASNANGEIVDILNPFALLFYSVGTYTVVIKSITINGCTLTLTSNNSGVIIVAKAPDLTPLIYVTPSGVNGTTNITVVVDVLELNLSPTYRKITVLITKDSKTSLSFNGTSTSIGSRSIQNSVWTFDDTSNTHYYILTTDAIIAGGDQLSVGLNGVVTPGASSGMLSISAGIFLYSGGDLKLTNNTDVDKVEYFAQ